MRYGVQGAVGYGVQGCCRLWGAGCCGLWGTKCPQVPPRCPPSPSNTPQLPPDLMRTPMERRKAWVSASVRLISSEKISLPAMAVNGVSGPKACAMPGDTGGEGAQMVTAVTAKRHQGGWGGGVGCEQRKPCCSLIPAQQPAVDPSFILEGRHDALRSVTSTPFTRPIEQHSVCALGVPLYLICL